MKPFAFVFPGQGSQAVGMLDAWGDHPAVVSTLKEASAALGEDIGRLIHDGPKELLDLTTNTQPVMLTAGIAAYRAWGAEGGATPAAVAGHSLGEYTALVAAGVLEGGAGARLVAARGAAMAAAAAVQPGTMAAVLGLDPEAVAAACAGVDGAWVANDNAPGQVVIAGTPAGVEAASAAARAGGAKRVIALAVSGAFHTPLMQPAQRALEAALAATRFDDATIACVANVDAATHHAGDEWRTLLAAQLTSPVRWRESQARLAALGVTTFIELGAGTELSGMVKRTVPGAVRANVGAPGDIASLPGLG
jgi:[acyl-carrier-protein] S-malonyltransferase